MPAHPVAGGLWGKLPSRGDFVRLGLPRGFTDAWDGWLSAMLVDSRVRLGPAWQDAWMVAPVWRFALQAGLCGPDAVLGVWMPSVDSAGRAYPLTLAACLPDAAAPGAPECAWLDAAEDAGLAALDQRLDPAAVAGRLPPLDRPDGPPLACGSLWWTERTVAPAPGTGLAALPDGGLFTRMLS